VADHPVSLVMDPIKIPESLDPSSRIGDAEPHHSAEERENRRKRLKPQTPAAGDSPAELDDESHQLDELA
jgi:hypothetical protein